MAYIGTQPKDIRSFGKAKFDFTATQGQTAFTGADDDGKTLGFTAGQVSVYVNGILMDDSDYTASNGNTITLTSAANASDIISVVALQTDIPNSDYVPATGGTFSGAVTLNGGVTGGVDVTGTVTADGLTVDGDASVITLNNTDTSLALGQTLGEIKFNQNDPSDQGVGTVASIEVENRGTIAGYGKFNFKTGSATSLLDRLSIAENGDISFYEDTGTTPKFFWDASAEALGIGTSSPTNILTVSTNGSTTPAINTFNAGNAAPITSYSARAGLELISYQSASGSPYTKTSALIANSDGTVPSEMQFWTKTNGQSSPAERLRLDSSGNVGIGQSSTDSKLTLRDDSDTTGPLITIKNQYRSGTTTADIIGGIAFSSWRDISPSASYVAGIYGRNSGYPGNSGYLSFCTGGNGWTDPYNAGSERVRITSDGSVQFANNLATGYGATFSTSSNSRDVLNLNSSSTGSTGLIHFFNPNGFLAAITTSGSSVQYNTSSDYRLKEDVKPITGASDRVLALRPVNFAWKVDGSRTDGFIAHEAQEIIPEAVTGTKDDVRIKEYEVTPAVYDDQGDLVSEAVMGTREEPYYQSIDQSKLVPLLTAALQEALNEIAALKDRVAALEHNK